MNQSFNQGEVLISTKTGETVIVCSVGQWNGHPCFWIKRFGHKRPYLHSEAYLFRRIKEKDICPVAVGVGREQVGARVPPRIAQHIIDILSHYSLTNLTK